MSEIIALIPARGGSKGIPRKNINPLGGKPLIAWTIKAALQSGKFSQVVVSTDDKEIAQVARKWGAQVPFMRPTELAQDDSTQIAVVTHAIRWLESYEHIQPDYVMLLQPTSPLRTAEDVDAAIGLLTEKRADSVVSVCAVHQHPYWTKSITTDGRLTNLLKLDLSYTRRQELPPAYALNGAIYLTKSNILMEQHTFYPECTYAYIMPPERSLDIDAPWELYLADLILKAQMNHETY